jgi:Multiubiquitin
MDTEEEVRTKPEIIVNGEDHKVSSHVVTYQEVVTIAFPIPPSPDARYTVSYRHAKEPHEGSLAPNQSVIVKEEGTVFNVKATGKS